MKNGFTLIELLVVVLIIGVLAAIALPQYQFAVEKARAVQGVVYTRAVKDAQERFYMANGAYTMDLTQLDLEVPLAVDCTPQTYSSMVSLRCQPYLWEIRYGFSNRTEYPELNNALYCWAPSADEAANRFCRRYTGTDATLGNPMDGNAYAI